MSDGIGCNCGAYSEAECACDADWTPAEVIRLRAENLLLRGSQLPMTRERIEEEIQKLNPDAVLSKNAKMFLFAIVEHIMRIGTTELQVENARLRGDHIECHQGRDIIASLYDAWHNLPACGMLAIVGGAIQEIQSLRPDAAPEGERF